MADTLYLSLWYPNLRLAALPGKLMAVLGAFAAHGGEARVYAATVWPVNWSEAPVFQRVYARMGGHGERGSEPGQAIEEALELLHEDYAYEFQIGWSLWELEDSTGAAPASEKVTADSRHGGSSTASATAGTAQDGNSPGRWAREPRLVRVTGFGPLFDEGAYEQEGHIRVEFGSDAPFLEEDADLGAVGARHVEENVRQLIELTAAIEKESGATARVLWSELGESLAQRLAARLGMRN
jgi:hypothetical protein